MNDKKVNIFEYATRNKLRFNYKGVLDTEALWNLGLNSLNEIYTNLRAEKKKFMNDSEDTLLVHTSSKKEEEIDVKIEIVKYIFEKKRDEIDERTLSAEKAERKRYLQELIHKKLSEADNNKSLEELQKELESL